MANQKKAKVDAFKIVLYSAILCLLLLAVLYWQAHGLQDIIQRMEDKGKMPNAIWVAKHGAYIVPIILVTVVLTLLYSDKSKYIPVITQKEKMCIALISAAFTYVVLLPYVIISSKIGQADAEDAANVKTLLDITVNWFFVQIVPFVLWITYHAIRKGNEESELAEGIEVAK